MSNIVLIVWQVAGECDYAAHATFESARQSVIEQCERNQLDDIADAGTTSILVPGADWDGTPFDYAPGCSSYVWLQDLTLEGGPTEDITTIRERATAYNAELNRLEVAPNGDDYNELLDIFAGHKVALPKKSGR